MAEKLTPLARLHTGEIETVPTPAEEFERLLTGIQQIVQTEPPDYWYIKVVRYMQRAAEELETGSPASLFFQRYNRDVLRLIQESILVADTAVEDQDERIAVRVQRLLVDVRSLIEFGSRHEPIPMKRLNWNQILESCGERCRLEDREGRRMLHVSSAKGQEYTFPIPTVHGLAHKGGICRLLLKLTLHAPADLIEAELPLNDFDVAGVVEDPKVREEAIRFGLADEGIEPASKELNFSELAAGRDVTLNQIFLDADGLTFSEAAREACLTGAIHIPFPDKGMFNSASIPLEDGVLANEWGMQRLLKFVVEGKARSFPFTPLNRQIDMGPFLPMLARKFSGRPNGEDLLRKMFFVADQMGQVREGERSMEDVLQRVNGGEPSPPKKTEHDYTQLNFVRWYITRSLRSINRAFRTEMNVKTALPLTRSAGDLTPYRVSLKGLE